MTVLSIATDNTNLTGFTNTSDKPLTVSITAEGKWSLLKPDFATSDPSIIKYKTPVDGDGCVRDKNDEKFNFKYPKLNTAALVAEVKDAKGNLKSSVAGKKQTIELLPGESVSFTINDDPAYFKDNAGQLKIAYSIVPKSEPSSKPATSTTGEGEFYTTDGSGNIALLKKHTDWRKTWQLIIPGNFGGNGYTDLLFYNPTTGEGEFYTTDGSGNIALLKRHTDWRKTWQLIIPGNFGGNGYTDLLFYDPTTPTTGEGEFYTTDGNGNIALLKKHTDWRKTWQLIVPGNFGGNDYTDLLFYDPMKGH